MCDCRQKKVETKVITGTTEPIVVPTPEPIIEIKQTTDGRTNTETE